MGLNYLKRSSLPQQYMIGMSMLIRTSRTGFIVLTANDRVMSVDVHVTQPVQRTRQSLSTFVTLHV